MIKHFSKTENVPIPQPSKCCYHLYVHIPVKCLGFVLIRGPDPAPIKNLGQTP